MAKVGHVVADSAAFIRNAPLRDIGEEIYTIQEVVGEVRDRATRERLQVLPYKLQFREPSAESIRVVTDFSKKTGDYRSLSAVDLRVLALTYQLEREHCGTAHIKTQPERNITFQTTKGSIDNPANIAGFYIKGKKTPTQSRTTSTCESSTSGSELKSRLSELIVTEETDDKENVESFNSNEECQPSETHATQGCGQCGDCCEKETCNHEDTSEESKINTDNLQSENNSDNIKEQTKSTDTLDSNLIHIEEQSDSSKISNVEKLCEAGETTDTQTDLDSFEEVVESRLGDGDVLPVSCLEEAGEEEEDFEEDSEEEEEEEEDGEGWITPSNIQQVKQQMGDINLEPARVKVACLTTDFAMQNVLIQMGLHVVSVDGMLIRRARSYVLRCYACFKISTDVTRLFCGHCGNDTLQRVAMTVNEDGSLRFYMSARKQPTCRGKRFSLPQPKGGKYAVNPVLVPDQREAQQRGSKASKQRFNVLDPNYITNASPFAPHDTLSRAAQLGFNRWGKRRGMGEGGGGGGVGRKKQSGRRR